MKKKKLHVITRVMIMYGIAVTGIVIAVQVVKPKNSDHFGARRVPISEVGNAA